jgi:hypothetical protein
MKCMLWSKTGVRGHPNLVKMHSYKNLARIIAMPKHNDLASTHLVV